MPAPGFVVSGQIEPEKTEPVTEENYHLQPYSLILGLETLQRSILTFHVLRFTQPSLPHIGPATPQKAADTFQGSTEAQTVQAAETVALFV